MDFGEFLLWLLAADYFASKYPEKEKKEKTKGSAKLTCKADEPKIRPEGKEKENME